MIKAFSMYLAGLVLALMAPVIAAHGDSIAVALSAVAIGGAMMFYSLYLWWEA